MELFTMLLISVGLAMDAFAVSLGVGTAGKANSFRAKFRLAFHFGFFQTMMTILGWLAGSSIAGLISGIDHWIAFILLGYVGLNMARSGLNHDQDSYSTDPSKGKTLMMLCVATSIDAMAVGLSMAMIGTAVFSSSLMIGLVTLFLSSVGLYTGAQLGEKFGKRMEILGGCILIFIGLRVVITHLFPTIL
jgi:putative Mn2+ efflux pump MntP